MTESNPTIYGKPIKGMTDNELLELFQGAYSAVEIVACFGTSDVMVLELAERELNRRGYGIQQSLPEIVKADPEEEE